MGALRREESMAKVKPFWESASQETRLDLLSIPLSELKQRAAEAGAKQRRDRGGQAASQCHSPGVLGWSSGAALCTSSSNKQLRSAPGSRARWAGCLVDWHPVRAAASFLLLSSTGHLRA